MRTNDFLLTSASSALLDKLIAKLEREWKVVEQCPVRQHMVIAIQRDASGVHISAPKHIMQLLDTFGILGANPCKLPHDPNADMSAPKTDEPKLAEPEKPLYGHAIGVARFLADTVLCDIAYITSVLARALENSTSRHYAALKRLQRYFAGRTDAEIYYKSEACPALAAYSDSDRASCRDTWRSRSR